ncbi:HAD-IIIA family hydrolase [bacterium]|nr:HAD-IIIA family hydrolase [bacterium]
MSKQAVLLVGGFGKRLSSLVNDVPKPMAKIGNIPFLDYLINNLKNNGFDNFVFLTGYKSEIISEYFKNLEKAVFIKEETPLGTGGALLNAFNYLNDEFFVINGDTFFDIDFSIIDDFSVNKPCTIALNYTNNISRYGMVDIDDSFLVNSFVEKGKLSSDKIDCYINGGIYKIKKEILSSFYNSFNNNFISLENDIFPLLVKSKSIYGLPLGGAFIDIGIPEDYISAQSYIPEKINEVKKPALFIDKDGTIIENTGYPSDTNIKFIPETVEIIKKYYEKKYYIVMITNQAGIGKAKFTKQQMLKGFEIIKNYYSKFNISFDDIQYCPFHVDSVLENYKYYSLLRKPNPGMILSSCEKLKIDLKNSVMIGDNKDIDKIKLPYLKSIIL